MSHYLRQSAWIVFVGGWAIIATGQAPVFEDTLINNSKINGQYGSGTFSAAGYTLSHSGGYDEYNTTEPRSIDFVWYDKTGTWTAGTIEFDVSGLNPASGCTKNEIMLSCDSTGLNPATTGGDFYNSPYSALIRKSYDDTYGNTDRMKMAVKGGSANFEERSNVLSWNGTTTYRFRMTWDGSQIRWYRGTPGQTLTEINPPSPQAVGTWSPAKLHIQLGATFRAGVRGVQESGGEPGTCYSLLRIYTQNLGNAATPVRGGSFTPGKATNPNPANEAIAVSESATLSWSAGSWANTHKVYFGTSNPPPYRGEQTATSFNPGTMDLRTVHYWRIDEVNNTGTTTGDLWTFTTKSVTGDFDADTDVDLSDFGYLQRCFSGSGVTPISGCQYADLDGDNDVDANDFTLFKNCFGGANQPPGC